MFGAVTSFASRARSAAILDWRICLPALLTLAAFLPSFLYVTTFATSLALGILIVSLATVITNPVSIRVAAGCLLYSMTIFATAFGREATGSVLRLVIECAAHGLLVCAAISLGQRLAREQGDELYRMLATLSKVVCAVFLTIGIITVFYRPTIWGYDFYVKNMFPFSEPSHYALVLFPFLLFAILYSGTAARAFLFLGYSLVAFLQPSLILVLMIVGAALLLLLRGAFSEREAILRSAVPLACISGVAALLFLFIPGSQPASPTMSPSPQAQTEIPPENAISAPEPSVDYFAERMHVSTQNENLTVLVFLQGWDDAKRALIATNGLGLGFQSMGSLPPSEFAERIRRLTGGVYLNRTDGGSIAPKIVFEFGYFGIAMSMALAIAFAFCVWKLVTAPNIRSTAAEAMALCLLLSFGFEYFLRGYGYFSPGVFYALTGVAAWLSLRKKTTQFPSDIR